MKKKSDLAIDTEKLREILTFKCLTLNDLANKAGLSINTVSKIARKISFPNPSTMKKICDALEIDPAEIIIKNDK